MKNSTSSYSEELLGKVRKALADHPGIQEKKKMGGITFMRNGKLCVRVQGEDLMVRCEPGMTDELLTRNGARRYEMKGKTNMKGWLLVGPGGTSGEQDFTFWMRVTLDFSEKFAKK